MLEGLISTGDVTVQQPAGQELFSKEDLLEQYWHVSRCWVDHGLAVASNMTFECAIETLRRVHDQAMRLPGGCRLAGMASALMQDIVEFTEDVPSVENDED